MREVNPLQKFRKFEIPKERFRYDKSTKILSLDIFDFTFIGYYKKSTRLNEVLDDIHATLRDIQLDRKNPSRKSGILNHQKIKINK